jgi:hypothetical protein
MAILTTETSIEELRERFGDQAIFYERNGKKIMQSRPDYDRPDWKKKRQATFKRLNDAHKLAAEILSDPLKKAEYKAKCEPGQRAHDVLLKELYNKPNTVKPRRKTVKSKRKL